MAIKNRPTLKQQYDDYINRVAPYDGNPLIQKTEDNQVTQDFQDSALMKQDNEDSLNSPSSAISLDFATVDLWNIDSSGSGDSTFVITVSNLQTGQEGRIHIVKKSGDTYSFSGAAIIGINNLSQTGTALNFIVKNIGGVLVAAYDRSIAKSDAIDQANSDQLATSQAVKTLNDNTTTSLAAKAEKNRPNKTVTGTTYTLLSGDDGYVIYFSNSGSITVTLPTGLTDGFECTLVLQGSGSITISAGVGASLQSSGNTFDTQYEAATVYQKGGDVFNAWGNLL
jgi:hypothetical protein